MKTRLKIAAVFLVFILLFVFLNILLAPKFAESLVEGNMISEYYDAPKDHEVIFIGDCEVYANFSPLVMYEEQGIKAYVRGSSQQLIWQSYYILKETLKYETPRVVVFNVNAVRYEKNPDIKNNDTYKLNEAYNRLTIDKMKWSAEKAGIIKESMTEEETFISYIFPLLRYHSRYSQLTGEDFRYLFSDKKITHNGFLINKKVKAAEGLPAKRPLADYAFSEETLGYLTKISDLCAENGIRLILIKAPSLFPYWYDEFSEQIAEFADSHGADYYNFTKLQEEIGLDYSADTYDAGLHLNFVGAEKLSSYFAKILKEKYDLTDYSGDQDYDAMLTEYIKNREE